MLAGAGALRVDRNAAEGRNVLLQFFKHLFLGALDRRELVVDVDAADSLRVALAADRGPDRPRFGQWLDRLDELFRFIFLDDDLQVDDLFRREVSALEAVPVGGGGHVGEDGLFFVPDFALMEDVGLPVAYRVDEIAEGQRFKLFSDAFAVVRADVHRPQIGRGAQVVERGAVHHDHRELQLDCAQLCGVKGGRVADLQADQGAVGAEAVQLEEHCGGEAGARVGHEIVHIHEKDLVAVFAARQAEGVDADRHDGADQDVRHLVRGADQRLLDVREIDDKAEEDDRCDAGGFGLFDRDGGVEAQADAGRDQQVEKHAVRADRGEHRDQNEQREAIDEAGPGADEAAGRVLRRRRDVRLHAGDRRDRGLRGHRARAESPQVADHQADQHGDRRFRDALADARKPESSPGAVFCSCGAVAAVVHDTIIHDIGGSRCRSSAWNARCRQFDAPLIAINKRWPAGDVPNRPMLLLFN